MSNARRLKLPAHVAIIMDGNGRWAKTRKKPRFAGHRAARNSVEKIIRAAAGKGVSTLSLFAFSTENWARPTTEVSMIMDMIERGILDQAEKLRDENIRLRVLGSRKGLGDNLREKLDRAECLTARCDFMEVVFAINYSGRWSIIETTKHLAKCVHNNKLRAEEITAAVFEAARPMPDLPPVDLLIRSSGELRISNFHLWETAYAELYFTETLWPDFDEAELTRAIAAYRQRERRYGALSGEKNSAERL